MLGQGSGFLPWSGRAVVLPACSSLQKQQPPSACRGRDGHAMSGMRLACMCGHRSVQGPAAHLCRRARLLRDSDTKDLPVAPLVLPGGTAGRWVRAGTRAHLLGPSRPVAGCLCRQFAISRCRSSAMAQSSVTSATDCRSRVGLCMYGAPTLACMGISPCTVQGTHLPRCFLHQARFLHTICSTDF